MPDTQEPKTRTALGYTGIASMSGTTVNELDKVAVKTVIEKHAQVVGETTDTNVLLAAAQRIKITNLPEEDVETTESIGTLG